MKINVDWSKVWKLKPAISLEAIAIKNPAGFSDSTLAQASELSAEISLRELMQKHIFIKKIELLNPEIMLERNYNQQVNLFTWLDTMSRKQANKATRAVATKPKAPENQLMKDVNKQKDKFVKDLLTIEKFDLKNLAIKNGKLDFYDYYQRQKPAVYNAREVNIELKDFSFDHPSYITASLKLFDSVAKNIKFDGSVGPLKPNSVPASGKLNFNIRLLDIPKHLRKEYFANLILEPRPNDTVDFNTSFEGDLFARVAGGGLIDFKKIRLGKSAKKFIFLEGSTPFEFVGDNLATNPNLQMRISEGRVRLDKAGQLGMDTKVDIRNGLIYGFAKGDISGVDVNEFLSSFTDVEDQVFGTLVVPDFQFDFVGKDAEGIMKGLRGQGFVSVDDGNLAIFNKIFQAQALIKQLLKGKTKDYTKFSTMKSSFIVENERFKTPDLEIKTPFANVVGGGLYRFDSKIRYDLALVIAKRNFPLEIRGYSDDPSIKVNFQQVAQDEVIDRLEGLLNKHAKKDEPKPQAEAVEALTTDDQAQTVEEPPQTTKKKKPKEELVNTLLDFGLKELQKL